MECIKYSYDQKTTAIWLVAREREREGQVKNSICVTFHSSNLHEEHFNGFTPSQSSLNGILYAETEYRAP